jgi:hypothetical protein
MPESPSPMIPGLASAARGLVVPTDGFDGWAAPAWPNGDADAEVYQGQAALATPLAAVAAHVRATRRPKSRAVIFPVDYFH